MPSGFAIPSIERRSNSGLPDRDFTFSMPSSFVFTPESPTPASEVPRSSGLNVPQEHAQDDEIEGRMANSIKFPTSPVPQGSHLQPESQNANNSSYASRRRRSGSSNNRVRHEVRDEDAPNDPFHAPAFQEAYTNTKLVAAEMKTALESSTIHEEPDSVMRRLHGDAKTLAEFKCPSTRTVGFVGDSGVGKSSLMNSLLDYKGLARTSNSGAACTCVVTEYHYHSAARSFIISVVTFSKEEIKAQLTEMLQAYRQFHINGDSLDGEAREGCEQRANVALDTFHAMFSTRLQNENMLVASSESGVMRTLTMWLDEVFPSTIRGQHEMSSATACSDELMRLTTESASSSGRLLWPFIKKIKVSLNAHILSKGLVLVDLPGLRDLNSARQNITERYLLKCHQIFAICNIGRAATDVGVAAVFDLARMANLSHVGIVCTRADDIRAEEAKRDWQGERASRIDRLMKKIAHEKTELHEIDEILADEEWADVDEFRQLQREQRLKARLVHNLEFELKEFLMITRNTNVTAELIRVHQDKVPNIPLKVFCVSNTDYWSNREKDKAEFQPYLRLSGIHNVRRHCISIVGENQLRAAKNYIQNKMPAFLADVELWVQSGAGNLSAERKALVRQTLDAIDAKMQRDLLGRTSLMSHSARQLKGQFQEDIYEVRRTDRWSAAAFQEYGDWAGWHHMSFAAFCRNSGDYYTTTVGKRNWNEEAMAVMVGDITGPFRNICARTSSQQRILDDLVDGLMEWAIEHLETEIGDFCASSAALTQALDSHSEVMATEIEDAYSKLQDDMQLLQVDALSGIRTSIFGRSMESSYSAARGESGSGSDARRKDAIRRGITLESTYINHIREFKRRFDELATAFRDALRAKIEHHMTVIRGSMDIIRNENAALEGERDPEFRSLVKTAVDKARETLQGIQQAVA